MLDVTYYPMSAIQWFWHKIFGSALGSDNGFAWALANVYAYVSTRERRMVDVQAVRGHRRWSSRACGGRRAPHLCG